MSAFGYAHETRRSPYSIHSQPGMQPGQSYLSGGAASVPGYGRNVPRYDPGLQQQQQQQQSSMAGSSSGGSGGAPMQQTASLNRIGSSGSNVMAPGSAGGVGSTTGMGAPAGSPQILGYTPHEGSAGTVFSIHVAHAPSDSRNFRLVFGQRRVGALLEPHRPGQTGAVLSTQIPRFADIAWWSNKVPVYLLLVNPQTGEDVNQVQVGEFLYVESPSLRKRARDDMALGGMDLGGSGPIKRPSSQPLGGGMLGQPHTSAGGMAAAYSQQQQQQQTFGTPLRQPLQHAQSADMLYGATAAGQLHGGRVGFGQSNDTTPMNDGRYIAESRDQYRAGGLGGGTLGSSPYSYGMPQPSYGAAPLSASSWKSPGSTGSTALYAPSPASTLARSASGNPHAYDRYPPLSSEESLEEPVLQRTSTMSTSSIRASTPAGTGAAGVLGTSPWQPANRARLEIMGDLDDMARNWSAEEFGIRRRLVQFWRKQEGNVIRINFRPVEPGSTRPPNAVIISCIYWEERQECFFTSVDVIFLLESLVANRFAVEEKNRIRRNLEGFRPLTVSKGKCESESFFKLIMSFPPPKPRNIEKDVKAFPWRILSSALRKIIGKYSTSYNGLQERDVGGGGSGGAGSSGEGSVTPMPGHLSSAGPGSLTSGPSSNTGTLGPRTTSGSNLDDHRTPASMDSSDAMPPPSAMRGAGAMGVGMAGIGRPMGYGAGGPSPVGGMGMAQLKRDHSGESHHSASGSLSGVGLRGIGGLHSSPSTGASSIGGGGLGSGSGPAGGLSINVPPAPSSLPVLDGHGSARAGGSGSGGSGGNNGAGTPSSAAMPPLTGLSAFFGHGASGTQPPASHGSAGGAHAGANSASNSGSNSGGGGGVGGGGVTPGPATANFINAITGNAPSASSGIGGGGSSGVGEGRRPSDILLPVPPGSAGFSALDFGEFMFQSPAPTPGHGSGWPSALGSSSAPPTSLGAHLGAGGGGGGGGQLPPLTSAPRASDAQGLKRELDGSGAGAGAGVGGISGLLDKK